MALLAGVALADRPVLAAAQVQGFGKDLPLEIVLRQIVPPTRKVIVAAGIDQERTTSWVGGQPWATVLHNALNPLGLTALIDQTTVRIDRQGSAPQFTGGNGLLILKAAAQVVTHVDDQAVGNPVPLTSALNDPIKQASSVQSSPQSHGQSVPIAAASAVGGPATGTPSSIEIDAASFSSWMATAGDDLREVLATWAEQANWSIVWRSEYTYPLYASAVFDGAFTDAAQGLLQNFTQAHPPLRATFYKGNKVLVIENFGNIRGE
jgi:hypothetical protein